MGARSTKIRKSTVFSIMKDGKYMSYRNQEKKANYETVCFI